MSVSETHTQRDAWILKRTSGVGNVEPSVVEAQEAVYT